MIDANGQSLAYVYAGDTESDAIIPKVLTEDEARRIASNKPSYRSYCNANKRRPAHPNEKD